MSAPGTLSREELAILNVNQLKFAWQKEHDDRILESQINDKLKAELAGLNATLDSREVELNIERARADLSMLCSTYTGDPGLLIDAVHNYLPQSVLDKVTLTCCVRVGDAWASVRARSGFDGGASNLDASSSSQGSSSRADAGGSSSGRRDSHILDSPFLDNIAHQATAGSMSTLAEHGITIRVFNEIMGFHHVSSTESDQQQQRGGRESLSRNHGFSLPSEEFKASSATGAFRRDAYATSGSNVSATDFSDNIKSFYGGSAGAGIDYRQVFEHSHVIAILSRCVWFIVPTYESLFSVSAVNDIYAAGNDMMAPLGAYSSQDREHELEQEQGQYPDRGDLRADAPAQPAAVIACQEVAQLLTHAHWFPLMETASQLIMAALVTQKSQDRAVVDRLTAEGLTLLSRNFFNSGTYMDGNAVSAQLTWQGAAKILERSVPDCQVELVVVSAPESLKSASSDFTGDMAFIGSNGQARTLNVRDSSACLLASSVLGRAPKYVSSAHSGREEEVQSRTAPGRANVDIGIDCGDDGSFVSFLAVPLWHWTPHPDSIINGNMATPKKSLIAGGVIFRSRKDIITGRQRETALSVIDAAAPMMEAWMKAHASAILNPMTGAIIISALGQACLTAESAAYAHSRHLHSVAGSGSGSRQGMGAPATPSPYSPQEAYRVPGQGDGPGLNRSMLSMSMGMGMGMSPSPVRMNSSPYGAAATAAGTNMDVAAPQAAAAAAVASSLAEARLAMKAAEERTSLSASLLSALGANSDRSYVEFLAPIPQLIYSYIDVDWLVALCVERDAAGAQKLTLLGRAADRDGDRDGGVIRHIPFDLSMVDGQLRDLFVWLLRPSESEHDASRPAALSGLSAAHVEPAIVDLASCGILSLLAASSGGDGHGSAHRDADGVPSPSASAIYSLQALPPQACPVLGARFDYFQNSSDRGHASTSHSSSSGGRHSSAPDVSLLVISGRFWREFALQDMMPKLQEIGSMFELAFRLRATEISARRIFNQVADIKTTSLREQKASEEIDAFYLQLHALEAQHTDADGKSLLSAVDAGVPAALLGGGSIMSSARKSGQRQALSHRMRLGLQSLKKESYRQCVAARLEFVAALQNFLPKVYSTAAPADDTRGRSATAASASDSDDSSVQNGAVLPPPACQLVISETVAEEGSVRLWVLGEEGDWLLIRPTTRLSSLSDAMEFGGNLTADGSALDASSENIRVVVSALLGVTRSERLLDLYSETTESSLHEHETRHHNAGSAIVGSSSPVSKGKGLAGSKAKTTTQPAATPPSAVGKDVQLTVWAILGRFGPGRWDRSILVPEGSSAVVGGSVRTSANKSYNTAGIASNRGRKSRADNATARVSFNIASNDNEGKNEDEEDDGLRWHYQSHEESAWIVHAKTFVSHHRRQFLATEDSVGLVGNTTAVCSSLEACALESFHLCSEAGHFSAGISSATDDAYLGSGELLSTLKTAAPDFVLIPIHLSSAVGEKNSRVIVTDLRAAAVNYAAGEGKDRSELPEGLSLAISEAARAVLTPTDSAFKNQLYRSRFITIAGGLTEEESSITLLNTQGEAFERYILHGNATDAEAAGANSASAAERMQARAATELTPHSRILLYLSPANNSAADDIAIAEDNPDSSYMRTTAFLIACRSSRLVVPSYFRSLATLLDSVCTPLRISQALLPLFNVWLSPEKVLLSSAPQIPFILPREAGTRNPSDEAGALFDEAIEIEAAATDGSGITSIPAFSNGTAANIVNTWFAASHQEIDSFGQRNGRKGTCILGTAYLLAQNKALADDPSSKSKKAPARAAASAAESDDAYGSSNSFGGTWALQLINESTNGQHARIREIHAVEQELELAANPLPYSSAEANGPNFGDSRGTVAGVPATKSASIASAYTTYSAQNIFSDTGYDMPTHEGTDLRAQGAEVGLEERPVPISSRFYEGLDHRALEPYVRLVRIFLTIPLAWAKRLVAHTESGDISSAQAPGTSRKLGHVYGSDRVVIASLCFWFESSSPVLPSRLKMALIRSAAHVNCIISSLMLEAVKILVVQENLTRRLERACFRAEAQAGAISGVYAAALRGLEVGAQVLHDHAQESKVAGGVAAIDAFGMLDALEKTRGYLGPHGGVTEQVDTRARRVDSGAGSENGSEDSMVVQRLPLINSWDAPLGLQETQWIHKTVNAAITVSTVMATAIQQLNDERANSARARKEKAALTVQLRTERALLSKFAFDVARFLPGGDVLAARAKTALQSTAAASVSHRREMKLASAFLEEIKLTVDLTSQALGSLLEKLTPLALRDEASCILMKMSSYALFDKLRVRESLREDTDKGDNPVEISEIEQKITSNGLVIWCDCNPAPDAAPDLAHDRFLPMKGVIRPDLLMLAWRRGIPSSGPAAANLLHYQETSLGPGERYFVEYIPVNLKAYQYRAHSYNRVGHGSAGSDEVTSEFPIAIVQYVTVSKDESVAERRPNKVRFDKNTDGGGGIGGNDSEPDEHEGGIRAKPLGSKAKDNSSNDTDNEKGRAQDDDADLDASNNKFIQRTIRGWLENLLREMAPKTKAGGISNKNITCTSIVGVALRALVHSNKEPLAVAPMSAAYLHHAQHGTTHHKVHAIHSYERESWASFSLAAGALIAAQMRGNGVLFHPHADSDDSEDLWGVASMWEKDGVVADAGPMAFTAEMWKKIRSLHVAHKSQLKPGVAAHASSVAPHEDSSAVGGGDLEIVGPILVKNLFHGSGDKCLVAVSFTVPGYDHSNWLITCLTDRLLGEEDSLMMLSIAEMLQTLAQNRIVRARNQHHEQHLQMMSGHLSSQTSDALLFRELWGFLDSLYSIPVVHVKDLSTPIREIRHLAHEQLSQLIGAAKVHMVPVNGQEVLDVMQRMVKESARITDSAAKLTGEASDHKVIRKHGVRCIASGAIVHELDIRAKDGTEIFWIPITELNSENEAFSAIHSGEEAASRAVELSRTMWAVQAWVHPSSHLYMFLKRSGEVTVLGGEEKEELHNDLESASDDYSRSDAVMQAMKKSIDKDISRKNELENPADNPGEMQHGKSLYEIFTVCVQGIRQHLHLIDIRLSIQQANRLSSFDSSVNAWCVSLIEVVGVLVGDNRLKSYPALGAALAHLTPEPEALDRNPKSSSGEPMSSDDCTLLARLHWFDGTNWQTVDVDPPEVVVPPQEQRRIKQKNPLRTHRSDRAADGDSDGRSTSESGADSDNGAGEDETVEGYEGDSLQPEQQKRGAYRTLAGVDELLEESNWTQRTSSISASLLNKISDSNSHSEMNVAVFGENSASSGTGSPQSKSKKSSRARSKDEHKSKGRSSVDVCFNVSSAGQKAVLELSLLVTTNKIALSPSSATTSQKTDEGTEEEFQSRIHKSLMKLVGDGSIMLLGKHVTQVVGLLHSMQDHDHTADSFERTLDLARENAAVLAGCLNELCNEGKASTTLDYTLESGHMDEKLETGERDTLLKTSSYIEVMISRTQREILKLPGVHAIHVHVWDTIDKLQLYKKGADCQQVSEWLQQSGAKSGLSAKTLNEKLAPGSSSPGVTSEFTFECGEISGILALTWLDSYMAVDGSAIVNGNRTTIHTVSEAKQKRFGAYSLRHREETSLLLAALVKALARRVFELHRGHHNKKLMIMQQRNMSKLKADLGTRSQIILDLESKKSVLATQNNQYADTANRLEAELVAAKKAAEELSLTNKKLLERTTKATAGIRAEYTMEIESLRASATARERELQDEIARRQAVLDHMRTERAKDLSKASMQALAGSSAPQPPLATTEKAKGSSQIFGTASGLHVEVQDGGKRVTISSPE